MTDMNMINFEALESVTGGKDIQVKNSSVSYDSCQIAIKSLYLSFSTTKI